MWKLRRVMWGVSRGLPVAVISLGLLTLACGLGSPTRQSPETQRSDPDLGGLTPGNAPPASPSPSPGDPSPSPSPSATPDTSGCGDPLPPPISQIAVKVHLKGSDAWTLDSTPLVFDRAYCSKIGFTDGRSFCPVRPEGSPQRAACELYAVGRAADTNRPGPTWHFHEGFCTGRDSGCMNSPDNQYQLKIYVSGTFKACARNGVCGEVLADR